MNYIHGIIFVLYVITVFGGIIGIYFLLELLSEYSARLAIGIAVIIAILAIYAVGCTT